MAKQVPICFLPITISQSFVELSEVSGVFLQDYRYSEIFPPQKLTWEISRNLFLCYKQWHSFPVLLYNLLFKIDEMME